MSKKRAGRTRTTPHPMRPRQRAGGPTHDSVIITVEHEGMWYAWLLETYRGKVEVMKDRWLSLIRFPACDEQEARKVAAWWWGLSRVLRERVPADPPEVEELKTNQYLRLWHDEGLPRYTRWIKEQSIRDAGHRMTPARYLPSQKETPSIESSF